LFVAGGTHVLEILARLRQLVLPSQQEGIARLGRDECSASRTACSLAAPATRTTAMTAVTAVELKVVVATI
jgi:hypothetical protein